MGSYLDQATTPQPPPCCESLGRARRNQHRRRRYQHHNLRSGHGSQVGCKCLVYLRTMVLVWSQLKSKGDVGVFMGVSFWGIGRYDLFLAACLLFFLFFGLGANNVGIWPKRGFGVCCRFLSWSRGMKVWSCEVAFGVLKVCRQVKFLWNLKRASSFWHDIEVCICICICDLYPCL